MKTTKKEVFDAIHTAKRTHDQGAAEVAKAESALASAVNALEKAAKDDGVTAPEKIFERSEAARRELSICEIAANRAKAKLHNAEEHLLTVLTSSIVPIRELLGQKERDVEEEMRKQISPIIGEMAANSDEFSDLVGLTDKVGDIREILGLLGQGAHSKNPPAVTIEAIFNSEKLL